MKTRFLGNTGVRVSELCFGAMTFGGKSYFANIGQVQEKEADELVNMAVDGGINFFDTADVYSEGLSEQLLGKALGPRRNNIVDELEKITRNHDATITQAALNYLLRKPGVTSVIIGARNKEQLADNLKTAEWEMAAEEVARLDALSTPPRAYPYWTLERTSQDR